MNITDIIKVHEGFRCRPYRDTTGNLTIGWGRNLDANGISVGEAELMLRNDIEKCIESCAMAIPKWDEYADARRAVFISMCFNLGIAGLLQFKEFIHAASHQQWVNAAGAMLESRWAVQVGHRAIVLAQMMQTGQWPTTDM
jgi:lysozyme